MAVCCILVRFDDMPVKKSGIRTQSQELQELQNMRAKSLSENPGPASSRENLRRNPRFFSS